ncbi:MAG TPA: long-chain fatty acid--CoA ligase [Sphingomonadaceae bacterium]|nr:long-chain fatty acid--CoA ligase [Sphingomonadaceae bacterium]
MRGAMQDWPLRIPRLLDHAAREHGGREIVSRWADGRVTRTDWAGIHRDARRFAQAMVGLGIRPGERIATLAMNHAGHLVAWYGAIGMGGVIHTINPRLFDDQIVYIANHAGDRVLLYDATFAPLVERLRTRFTSIEHYVCFDSTGAGGFEALLAPHDGDFAWVEGDERAPAMLCYTSGTTGEPKGVLYEHRSTVLHAITEIAPDVFDLSARSICLPVVPMFHAACWGLPFAAAATGAKLVFCAVNDPAALHTLIVAEEVTHSAGVPTVWLALFQHLDATGGDFGPLRIATIGGSAAPRAMVARLMAAGVRVRHAWGMTETSPIGTVGGPPASWEALDRETRLDWATRQGRASFGAELRIVDDAGQVLPRDGATAGRLEIRGAWVVRRYFAATGDAVAADGWFDTGDIAIIHPDGSVQLTDRAKDVIKSGGEWISSIDLENAAMGCPGVAEAAAIGVRHPKWDERPLLLVVPAGAAPSAEQVMTALAAKVAKWWLPDEILFVESLPHNATGKILKSALRERYRDHRLPGT